MSGPRCRSKNKGGRNGFIDLTNATFGCLKVRRRATLDEIMATKSTNFTSARWICLCSCGAEKMVLGANLRNGKTKSCGAHSCANRPTTFDKYQPRQQRIQSHTLVGNASCP